MTTGRGVRHAFVNVSALAVIQVSNAVSPLIIYPFMLAVVGATGYTDVAIAEAMSLFLLTFVLYSFEIDGVAAVVGLSIDADGAEISRIYSQIFVIRTIFYLIGLSVLELVTFFTNSALCPLVLAWSLVSLGYAIQPNWLYQALEWNRPLAVTTLVSRIGAVVTILLMVRGPADYMLVPVAIGVWYFGGAIAAAAYAVWRFRLKLVPPTLPEMLREIWHGKEVFFGNVGVSLYRDINVLLLGAFGVPSGGIAAYSLAEKLVKAIQASIRPLNQFFFPRALAVAKREKRPSHEAFKGILAITLPQAGVVAGIIVCLIAGYLVVGPKVPAIGRIKDVSLVFGLTAFMSLGTFSGLANFMFGSAGLNAMGARHYMFVTILIVGTISVLGNCLLIPLIGAAGSAVCFVGAETLLFGFVARRYFVR